MGFRRKQKSLVYPCGGAVQRSFTEKDGLVVCSDVDACKEKLPASSNYDLKKLLDSGVSLEFVNTKVLGKQISEDDIEFLQNELTSNNED